MHSVRKDKHAARLDIECDLRSGGGQRHRACRQLQRVGIDIGDRKRAARDVRRIARKRGRRASAAQVDGIDFIASGHSHLFMEQPVIQKQPCGAETMIFQVGKSGIYMGRVDFTFRAGKVVAWSGKLVDLRET